VAVAQCNAPMIGSYNNYHLSPNGKPSGNQRWYGLVYKWLVSHGLIGKGHVLL